MKLWQAWRFAGFDTDVGVALGMRPGAVTVDVWCSVTLVRRHGLCQIGSVGELGGGTGFAWFRL
jgi:hypothetical protein